MGKKEKGSSNAERLARVGQEEQAWGCLVKSSCTCIQYIVECLFVLLRQVQMGVHAGIEERSSEKYCLGNVDAA